MTDFKYLQLILFHTQRIMLSIFSGLDTITAGKVNIKVSGTGSILLDFWRRICSLVRDRQPGFIGAYYIGNQRV